MTPAEFKAWFDGFTEAFSGCPTKAQWARIKDRVSEIDGKAVTERVYIDRYMPNLQPYLRYYGVGIGSPTYCGSLANTAVSNTTSLQNTGYHSLTAMSALGRSDAQALAS